LKFVGGVLYDYIIRKKERRTKKCSHYAKLADTPQNLKIFGAQYATETKKNLSV